MRGKMAGVFLICGVLFATVEAQVLLQRQPSPETTATRESWYLSAEPVALFGDIYYPTGPTVYFNGNTMVPTAIYGGVMIYADTTLEPYSIVFVPIGGGLLRPYERRRAGTLAGTVGSTTPSFPVQQASEGQAINPLIWPSAALPVIPTTLSSSTERVEQPAPQPVGTSGSVAEPVPAAPTHMATLTRPSSNDGIWIEFEGTRWRAAGKAQELSEARFARHGNYAGFPVYVDRGTADLSSPDRIFLPVAPGRVTPYDRVQ